MRHTERHRIAKVAWLRAAVLGANDGIVSTASLIVGVAAANASPATVLTTALAGLVAGAMSMAAGEYVSVHSQADSEAADIEREKAELRADPRAEMQELIGIYTARGLARPLAEQVAAELMKHDALGSHVRDELGITEFSQARPLQAALASAGSFATGAALPVLAVWLSPAASGALVTAVTSVFFLAALGAVAARAGGADMRIAALRVAVWGALAMAVTAGGGLLFDAVVK